MPASRRLRGRSSKPIPRWSFRYPPRHARCATESRKEGIISFSRRKKIYGNYYGTLRQEVDRALESGRHILFDIDVKGGLSIRNRYPESLLIFIRPPSLQVLRERLRDRKTENDDAVSLRMERVPLEMQLGVSFDYQVVNDDLPRAIAEVNAVVSRYLQVN